MLIISKQLLSLWTPYYHPSIQMNQERTLFHPNTDVCFDLCHNAILSIFAWL